MDSLRWILISLGLVVLFAVFAFSRGWFAGLRPAPKSTRQAPTLDPTAGDDSTDSEVDAVAASATATAARMQSIDAGSKLIAVRILPQQGDGFPAEHMVLALRAAGLRHGQYGIFHFHDTSDEQRIRFSVASLVEPGSFDLSGLKDSVYSGVSIFAVFPAPENGVQLFDDMVAKAREISKAVEGVLADEAGGALSLQRERYMREDLIEYLRRVDVAAGREEYQ